MTYYSEKVRKPLSACNTRGAWMRVSKHLVREIGAKAAAKIKRETKPLTPEQTKVARATTKLWKKNNPQQVAWMMRASCHNRRARKFGITQHIRWQQLRDIYNMFGGKCAYCGISESENTKKYGERIGFDHVTPMSLGGDNTPGNIVVCCKGCNSSKQKTLLCQWEPRQHALA